MSTELTVKLCCGMLCCILNIAGCTTPNLESPSQEELHEVVFHAGWAPETKTVLQEDGSVLWSPGDEISLFVGEGNNGGYKLTSTNNEPSATTDFVGNISKKSSTETYTAIYPYNEVNNVDGNTIHTVIPAIQTAKEGTFEQKTFISIARSDNENLYFRNLCSGIKFSVKNAGIKKIVISTRDDASIAGGVSYSIDSGNGQFDSEASSKVTVNAPSETGFEVGKFYYAVLFPFKNDSGVDITYCTEDKTAVFEYQMPIEFKRGVFKRLYEKDADLQFHGSKAIFKTNVILPEGVDKTLITQALFLTGNDTKTETVISCSAEDGYEPIYFELDGTVAKYYTNASTIELQQARYMFNGWEQLCELDLSDFETSHCYDMECMFNGCSSLEKLDISNFDVSNISQSVNLMFANCSKLSVLKINSFKNDHGPSSNAMFLGCSAIKSLDLSEFSIGDNCGAMFYYCSSLETIKMPSIMETCNNMDGMFAGCETLKSVEFGKVNTINVSSARNMFYYCKSLIRLDLSKFNFKKLEDASNMFAICNKLETLTLPTTPTICLKNTNGMFAGCSNLAQINFRMFDTSNVTNMGSMFGGCSFEKYDFSGFDTSNVKDMSRMFAGTTGAAKIDLSSFNTSNVTDMSGMFSSSCVSELDLTSFDTANVLQMDDMFWGCTNLRNIDISSFSTPKVTSMKGMFSHCLNLENVDFHNFKAEALTNMDDMFTENYNLLSINFGLAEISETVTSYGCCRDMSKLSGICAIKASESLKNRLTNDSSKLDSSNTILWVDSDKDMPEVHPVLDPSMYISSDYSMHKKVETLQSATEGNGIDIILMGDAYSDRLIKDGTYVNDARRIMDAIFSIEPIASYRKLFNVYLVNVVSKNEVVGKNTIFYTGTGSGTGISGFDSIVWEYRKLATSKARHLTTTIVFSNIDANCGSTNFVLTNSPGGKYSMKDNDSRTIIWVGMDTGLAFESTIRHEFGHGFAYLADEYWYEDENEKVMSEANQILLTDEAEFADAWKNIDITGDTSIIKWSKFLTDSRYLNENLGAFEGACRYGKGVWRPSENSVMNAGSFFNAPSREAIYYRIHKLAYGDDWQYDYETFVQQDLKNIQSESKASTQSVPYPARVNERKPFFKMEKIRDNDGREMIRMIMN